MWLWKGDWSTRRTFASKWEAGDCPGEAEANPPLQSVTAPHHPCYSSSQPTGCPSAVGLLLYVWRPIPLCSCVTPVTLSKDPNSFSILLWGLLRCVAASGRDGSSVTSQRIIWVSPALQGTARGGSGQTSPLSTCAITGCSAPGTYYTRKATLKRLHQTELH